MSDFLKTNSGAIPYPVDPLDSEDKLWDGSSITFDGDSSNMIELALFLEVLCEVLLQGIGIEARVLVTCCSVLDRVGKRTDCSAPGDRDSLEYEQLLPFCWHDPHAGLHKSHRDFARIQAVQAFRRGGAGNVSLFRQYRSCLFIEASAIV